MSIILIPLWQSIVYGKTEGSASPNAHRVSSLKATAEGALAFLQSKPSRAAQQALPGAKQCSGPQAEEGTRQPTAPGVLSSCLDSAKPSLTACYSFIEQSSTGSTQAAV